MTTIRISKATLSGLPHAQVRVDSLETRATTASHVRVSDIQMRAYGPHVDANVRVGTMVFRSTTSGSVRVSSLTLNAVAVTMVTARVGTMKLRAQGRDRSVYAIYDGTNWIDHETFQSTS